MFCKDDNGTITSPYTFRMLREDNPQQSFPSDVFTEAAYLPLLEGLNVFPVVENPPTFDPDTQRLITGEVLFIDPDYVLQYTIEDLTNDEQDDLESRGADWVRFCRRLLKNNNSPYRQMQVWALDAGKERYHNYMHDLGIITGTLRKVRPLRTLLTDLKANLGGDSFTNPQITEIDRLLGFLNVSWVWADL